MTPPSMTKEKSAKKNTDNCASVSEFPARFHIPGKVNFFCTR